MAAEARGGRDWTVPPGELLAELLAERGVSQSELARRMGRPVKTINEIVNGKAAVTPQTAIQLERVTGTSASFWVNAESAYRHDLARFAEVEALQRRAPWLDRFPIKDLVREGIVGHGPAGQQVEQLLRFFGVGSPEAWEERWVGLRPTYRQAAGQVSEEARAVWLRWGELLAADVETSTFDVDGVRRVLPDVARLSLLTPPQAAVEELSELLAGVGVALVLLPELPSTRLSGAIQWPTPKRPILQVSVRQRRDDQFWFTVLHELGHVVDAPGRTFTDADPPEVARTPAAAPTILDDPAERQADEIAREALVPSERLADFLAAARPDDREAIRTFARSLGVAPGIVVGRLQHDGRLSWASSLNDLKRRYEID